MDEQGHPMDSRDVRGARLGPSGRGLSRRAQLDIV